MSGLVVVVAIVVAVVGGYLIGAVEMRRRARVEWEQIGAAWDAVEDERRRQRRAVRP